MKRVLNKSVESNFVKSNLWFNKLKKDCIDQNVFLAIRNDEIDFYHKGGKLFGYGGKDFKTHIKYASVILKTGKDYLTQEELKQPKYQIATNFSKAYSRIKENCANYSGKEASGVSRLYHKYSYLSDSEIIVLDIEVSFQSKDNDKKQDRIDVLLFNKKTRTLQFVEAKHYSNKEIRSTTTPDVIKQVNRYKAQIIANENNIIAEYGKYIEILNNIFDIELPKPDKVRKDVSLLIFGFDNDQKNVGLKNIEKHLKTAKIKNYAKGDVKSIEIEPLWKKGL